MRLQLLWILAIGMMGQPPSVPPITVSAAISLSEVLEEVAAAYRHQGGGPVRFNLGGSNVLARQIINGAPVDVFVSADEAQMRAVEQSGAVRPGSVLAVASNQLAVVAAADRVTAVREAFARAGPAIRRLAMGDPAAVPAGVYARAWLERRGLWAGYQDRIVPTANVRSALAAVENGSADAAIVYATDVRQARRSRVAILVPPTEAPAIVYSAAVIARTRNKDAAERFTSFLQTPAAQAIFNRYGFLPPPSD